MTLLRRRPAFARLWLAGVVSEAGDWLLLIALPVYVLQRTGSALTTSTVLLLELAGTVLAGPLAGVLADRWDRRRLLVGGALAQAVLLLPLLAGTLPAVYAVALAQAVLATVNGPVRQALLPDAVAEDELVAATAQLNVASSLARLAGGALGGLLLGASGLPAVVLADAATFVLAAVLLAGWTGPTRAAATGPRLGMGRDALAGLAVVRADRRLRGAVVAAVLLGIAQGLFVVLYVLFVLRRLEQGPAAVGLLRGMQAVGAIAGGLALSAVARRLSPRLLAGAGCIGMGLVCLAIWNGPAVTVELWPYVGLFALVGLPAAAGVAGLQTVVLTAAPDRFRGRVLSTVLVVDAVANAVGTLLAGLLADQVGLLPLLQVHGALFVVAGLVALRTLGPPDRESSTPDRTSGTPDRASGAPDRASGAPDRPVAQDDPAEHLAGAVGAAVIGDQGIVPLQPPAAVDRPDRPLDDQEVGTGGEAADHDVAGPGPGAAPDQERVTVPQGRHHRRPDDQHSLDGPPE